MLPPHRAALLLCLVPILRAVLSIGTCRLVLNLRGVVGRIRYQVVSDDASHPSSQDSAAYLRDEVRYVYAQAYGAQSVTTARCERTDAWEGRRSHPLGSGVEHGHRWAANGISGKATKLTASGDSHWCQELPPAERNDEITELEVIEGYAT